MDVPGRRAAVPVTPRERGPPRVLLLNKPFQVLCAFTPAVPGQQRTLSEFVSVPDVYPAGRLDADSEGLVVLTNVGALQARLAEPQRKVVKSYWVCVEGTATEEQLHLLRHGVQLKDGRTQPAGVRHLDPELVESTLWPRTPPIRTRLSVPTCWLELNITEGRNRQVRRMTAAVQLPTLRLVRVRVGAFSLLTADNAAVTLPSGSCMELAPEAWRPLLE